MWARLRCSESAETCDVEGEQTTLLERRGGRHHRTASTVILRQRPRPVADDRSPRVNCASAWPCSAALRNSRHSLQTGRSCGTPRHGECTSLALRGTILRERAVSRSSAAACRALPECCAASAKHPVARGSPRMYVIAERQVELQRSARPCSAARRSSSARTASISSCGTPMSRLE